MGIDLEPKKKQEIRRGCEEKSRAELPAGGRVWTTVLIALRVRKEEARKVTYAQYSGSPGGLNVP